VVAGALFISEYRAFIERLGEARRASGVTQESLAERLAKPQSYVSKIERCERRLDVIEFCQICHVLGKSPGEFLDELLQPARSTD
jgi:transcriptional regulator with XRE-family HTH domain